MTLGYCAVGGFAQATSRRAKPTTAVRRLPSDVLWSMGDLLGIQEDQRSTVRARYGLYPRGKRQMAARILPSLTSSPRSHTSSPTTSIHQHAILLHVQSCDGYTASCDGL